MLCEKCRQREATVFLTQIVDGVEWRILEPVHGMRRDMWHRPAGNPACPDLRALAGEMQAAHCHYCGGQPCTGDNHFMPGLPGDTPRNFICTPCQMEFLRFMQQEMEKLAETEGKAEPARKLQLCTGTTAAAIRKSAGRPTDT